MTFEDGLHTVREVRPDPSFSSGTWKFYYTRYRDNASLWTGPSYALLRGDNGSIGGVICSIISGDPGEIQFDFDNPSATGTITSVTIAALCIRGTAKTLIVSGGTKYYGTADVSTENITRWVSTSYPTNPKTGVAWTWQNVTDLRGGIWLDTYEAGCRRLKLVVDYIDGNGDPQRLTLWPSADVSSSLVYNDVSLLTPTYFGTSPPTDNDFFFYEVELWPTGGIDVEPGSPYQDGTLVVIKTNIDPYWPLSPLPDEDIYAISKVKLYVKLYLWYSGAYSATGRVWAVMRLNPRDPINNPMDYLSVAYEPSNNVTFEIVHEYTNNPASGTAWTWGDLAQMRYGIKLVRRGGSGDICASIVNMYLEVTCTQKRTVPDPVRSLQKMDGEVVSYEAIPGQPAELIIEMPADASPPPGEIVLVKDGEVVFQGVTAEHYNDGQALTVVARSMQWLLEHRYIPPICLAPKVEEHNGDYVWDPYNTNDVRDQFIQSHLLKSGVYNLGNKTINYVLASDPPALPDVSVSGLSSYITDFPEPHPALYAEPQYLPGFWENPDYHAYLQEFPGLLFMINSYLPMGGWVPRSAGYLKWPGLVPKIQYSRIYFMFRHLVASMYRAGWASSLASMSWPELYAEGSNAVVRSAPYHPDGCIILAENWCDTHIRLGTIENGDIKYIRQPINPAGIASQVLADLFNQMGLEYEFVPGTDLITRLNAASSLGRGSASQPTRIFIHGKNSQIEVRSPTEPAPLAVVGVGDRGLVHDCRLACSWSKRYPVIMQVMEDGSKSGSDLAEAAEKAMDQDLTVYSVQLVGYEDWHLRPRDWISVQPEGMGPVAVRVQKITVEPGFTRIEAGKKDTLIDDLFGSWASARSDASLGDPTQTTAIDLGGPVGSKVFKVPAALAKYASWRAILTLSWSLYIPEGTSFEYPSDMGMYLELTLNSKVIPPGRIKVYGETGEVTIDISDYCSKSATADTNNTLVVTLVDGLTSSSGVEHKVTGNVNQYLGKAVLEIE